MTDKERELRIAAEAADSRAAMFEEAANGDWFHDPINYFAGISERQAAKRYLAEAEAEARKEEKVNQLESKIKSWHEYAEEEKKQAEAYKGNFGMWTHHHQRYSIALDEIRKIEDELEQVKAS